jgi:hypothetical protein
VHIGEEWIGSTSNSGFDYRQVSLDWMNFNLLLLLSGYLRRMSIRINLSRHWSSIRGLNISVELLHW